MSKLKKVLAFETIFGFYEVDELLGEGGAGRVYGGIDHDNVPIALKILAEDKATSDKRKRFKNEIAFLRQNTHRNIVTVTDYGLSRDGEIVGPFYVMPRFDGSLRNLMQQGIDPSAAMPLFSQILDGVEAAHLKGTVHRDLKPENILYSSAADVLAIADFGIASFTEDIVATLVETDPGCRVANFQYAAPEQRSPGKSVGVPADVYALGLIFNEMFTQEVPHGTEYRSIGSKAESMGFLDQIVAKMLRQAPEERPASIAELKGLIQRHQSEAVSKQRLSKIDGTVIKSNQVDEPSALEPPRLIDADWDRGALTLTLDRPVTQAWIQALNQMGSYLSVMGKPPANFSFRGAQAVVPAREHEVQLIIDYFKTWLPNATHALRDALEKSAQRQEAHQREQSRLQRVAEEERLRVLRNIRI